MSPAAIVFVLSVLLGFAVLGVLGWRLFQGVRSLGRTVGEAAGRIEAVSANLPDPDARPYTEAIPRAKGSS